MVTRKKPPSLAGDGGLFILKTMFEKSAGYTLKLQVKLKRPKGRMVP
ncbi:hypothetical protein DCCM_3475 [Desulfocucumis palustris]|uniref:Uncharacterized protein n=1 Tax=Desulfocucumis palustris TaxID=1898651 RepID=A0A2L2XF95_9FIRM|nr:hypothetical protein DCCM_3475 [Desulfocucumis palustris]